MARVLSGIVAIPIVLGIVVYGSPWLFFALVFLAVMVGCREFFSMISRAGTPGFPLAGYPLAAALLSPRRHGHALLHLRQPLHGVLF